ncbi:MAG TPA: hypothetical protein VEF53_03305 [Patescibacteria group bacterium]|nr:hypothetical protein [Patescibacteria group bacterium]
MKKTMKIFILMLTVLSLISMNGGFVFASSYSDESVSIVKGISKVTISATRSTSTNAKITATGPLTAVADSIKTTATLYEYNSSTGALTSTGKSVIKTDTSCSTYKFTASFSINAAKIYKVKLEVTQTTNGTSNTGVYYSNAF